MESWINPFVVVAFNTLAALGGGLYALGKFRGIVEAKSTQLEAAIASQVMTQSEKLRKEMGELGHALRAKIHEVELWSRDNFIRRDSFHASTEQLRFQQEAATIKIENQLLRVEATLEGIKQDQETQNMDIALIKGAINERQK